MTENPETRPFRIEVPQKDLDDLQTRLAMTRWPDEIDGAGWDYGTNMSYLKELVEYWQNDFDWREQEAKLNELSHFKTEIDGLEIHFIHERGKGETRLHCFSRTDGPTRFTASTK